MWARSVFYVPVNFITLAYDCYYWWSVVEFLPELDFCLMLVALAIRELVESRRT